MNTPFLAEGGRPITEELATELRQLIFGTSAVPLRAEWTQTAFIFGTPKEDLAYGLRSQRNATRGLFCVVQGFVLKYLLFSKKVMRGGPVPDPLNATAEMQKNALINAFIEILRIISDKGRIIMVLPSVDEEPFITHSVSYFHDSITERLYVFSLSPHEELETFVKRHYNVFTEEGGPGALLFLYSAVLTRTLGKVRTDLDTTKVMPLTTSQNEEGSLMIVMLLVTGRATPYIHNGVIHVGDENSYAMPQYGVLSRCPIGLLLWDTDSGKNSYAAASQPGSRLKTPNLPIWITCCTGHFGVLFNRNPELLRNYHAESRFDITYYSCSGHQIVMTIDNRANNEQAYCMLERQSSADCRKRDKHISNYDFSGDGSGGGGSGSSSGASSLSITGGGSGMAAGSCGTGGIGGGGSGGGSGSGLGVGGSGSGGGGSAGGGSGSGGGSGGMDKQETAVNTPLAKLIHTKWEEAKIEFHAQPSMLSYLFGTTQ